MKKTILFVVLTLAISGCSAISKLKPIEIKPEFTALKANEDVNAVKTEIQGDIAGQMEKLAEEMRATLQAQASANIGMNNKSESISAGGDVVRHTESVNDTELMKYIFAGLFTLLGSMFLYIKHRDSATIKQLQKEKQDYKENFLARCIKDEKELAEWRVHHEKVKKEAAHV